MSQTAVPWRAFEQADEPLARRVRARFESHRHAVLATLHADGSPRMSGMEAPIRSGQLWLGMTPGSIKAVDLARDGRYSLHSAPDDEELRDGDARIEGIVVPADSEQRDEFLRGHRYEVEDPAKMVLYVALISRAVLVRVADRSLLIESWTPEGGHCTRRD